MKRRFTSLGLLQIFLALMLVMIIMFISTYLVYQNSISGIYEEVTEKNGLLTQSVIQSYDNSFRTINSVIHSIHILPATESLRSSIDDSIDMSRVFTMVEHIGNIVAPYDFIEEVAVFYDDTDLVITSGGSNQFDYFFNAKYRHGTYNANYWRNYMRSGQAFKVFTADDYRVADQTDVRQYRTKKLLVAVGGNKVRTSNKNIMVYIDMEKLLKYVNQLSLIPGGSMMMLDQDRNVLLSTDNSWDLVEVLDEVYFSNTSEVTLTRKDYEYRFHMSDYNGFIYIDRVPYQFANVDSVASANVMIMISAIISAVILSVFLSIYLNRPVKTILKQLGGGTSKGNDFRKILSGIVKLQSENETYRKQTLFAGSELRKSVFIQALDGLPHAAEHDIQMQTYYADFFRHKHFVMVLLRVGRTAQDEREDWTVEDVENRLELGFIRDGLDAAVFHLMRMQVVIMIGVEHANARNHVVRQIGASLARMQKEEFKAFSLWGCVSKLYTSEPANCQRAYQAVQHGALYRTVGDNKLLLDVEDIRYVWSIYYPIEKMEKLSNYLAAGKLQEAIQLVKETIKENTDRNIHHHQLIHLAEATFFYMLRLTEGSSKTNQELYELEQSIMLRLQEAGDSQEVEQTLIAAAKHLASAERQDHKSKMNPTFISQYIDLHYMENLYLDDIAAVLNTTPKYFSNYFKKTFGINYVEYLNKVRLTHAKELLRDSNLSIAEIGEKTGYLNASTFTTTFKKFYGIAPSEFRRQSE